MILIKYYNNIGGRMQMEKNKYKNIQLTRANCKGKLCVTHSGKFHVDDVISTIFLSKIRKNIVLIRVATIDENLDIKNKLVYDIGLRRI